MDDSWPSSTTQPKLPHSIVFMGKLVKENAKNAATAPGGNVKYGSNGRMNETD